MDFYAFLPSNASPDVYPDNKTSHFKIQLSKRMELHGRWQAALIELHYPNTIAQVLEGENEMVVYRKTDNLTHKLIVKPGSYPLKHDFLLALHEALTPLEALPNKIGRESIVEETGDHTVVFYPFDHSDQTTYTFSPRLALQLGLEHTGPFPANQPMFGRKQLDISLGMPAQMYVYMDILADQIIGHTRAPLLRTVPADINARYGSMSIFHCEHPIYFDLNTKSFDTLQIDIRDHAGRYVPFDFGTSTLLVHFRQL